MLMVSVTNVPYKAALTEQNTKLVCDIVNALPKKQNHG